MKDSKIIEEEFIDTSLFEGIGVLSEFEKKSLLEMLEEIEREELKYIQNKANNFSDYDFIRLFLALLVKEEVIKIDISTLGYDLIEFYNNEYYKELFNMPILELPESDYVDVDNIIQQSVSNGILSSHSIKNTNERFIFIALCEAIAIIKSYEEKYTKKMEELVNEYINKKINFAKETRKIINTREFKGILGKKEKEKLLLELKKKLLTLGLITTTSITTLTGCGNEENITYKYVVQEDGSIEFDGNISYDNLKKNNIIIVSYTDNSKNFYITNGSYVDSFRYNGNKIIAYINIKNGKKIIVEPEKNTDVYEIDNVEEYNIDRYLTKIDFIKEFYTEEDLDYILEEFKKNYEESLKLSKTKE